MAALRESAVVLVIASPKSIPSPWVNFESGAGENSLIFYVDEGKRSSR